MIAVRRIVVMTVKRNMNMIGLNVDAARNASVTIATRRMALTQYDFVTIATRATVVNVGFLCAKR